MNKNTIVMVVLVVLVLISAVQAIQLNNLKKNIASGSLTVKSKTQTTSVASGSGDEGGASLPSNIQNLPQMVGGC